MKIVAAIFLWFAMVFTTIVISFCLSQWHVQPAHVLDQAVWAAIAGIFWTNINALALFHDWK